MESRSGCFADLRPSRSLAENRQDVLSGGGCWRLKMGNICGLHQDPPCAYSEVESDLSITREMNIDLVYPPGTEPSSLMSVCRDK